MKVLILPFNPGSMGSTTVEALNNINGITAKGLFVGRHKYQQEGKNCTFVDLGLKNHIVNSVLNRIIAFFYFLRLVLWADNVYYIWNSFLPFGIDIKIVSLLKKNALIEWVGSEIRNPEIAKKLSPYMEQAYNNGYEYKALENADKSYQLQKKFSNAGFYPIVVPEMNLYIFNELFSKLFSINYRINIKNFKANYPKNDKPIIVHTPTAAITKGSNIILPIIEELKQNYDFDFILLNGLPREEVHRIVQDCDIFLDQIMLGSHGVATCEAMAMGKPTVCYIMPAVFEAGLPKESPIVNANPDTLKATLIELITNASLRKEIGVKSRQYIEKYHDADKIAVDVYNVFKEIALLKK
ncbi:MAG: glycosyltransferase [Pseudarcicella sp.]|nr:glycosyltransferase [Pseudarcicella sp.]